MEYCCKFTKNPLRSLCLNFLKVRVVAQHGGSWYTDLNPDDLHHFGESGSFNGNPYKDFNGILENSNGNTFFLYKTINFFIGTFWLQKREAFYLQLVDIGLNVSFYFGSMAGAIYGS